MSRVLSAYPPERVILREVGLRDGLQMVGDYPSTAAKTEWLWHEAAAGVKHFEIGSFLPAKAMPQFADVRDIIEVCYDLDVHSAALVLNEHGARDAIQSRVGEIVTVVSATEQHSRANARRTRAEAIDLVSKTVLLSQESVEPPLIQTGISMAFGCSIEGQVDPDEVVRLAASCVQAGADIIGIADTVGFAGPDQVTNLVERIRKELGDIVLSIHLHDTRGMGIANASAALDAGIRIIDGSLGGLGGCPFAPGATGNVTFEDLVYLCERKGFATGVDLKKLMSAREIVASAMPDEQLFGAMSCAGEPRQIEWRATATP